MDPQAVDAMKELGIDMSDQTAKDVSRFLGQRFTYVILLCNRPRNVLVQFFQEPSGGGSGTLKTLLARQITVRRCVASG